MKTKFKLKLLCVFLSISMIIPITSFKVNAYEVINNGSYAIDDDKMLDYDFENSDVKSNINSLVSRTQNLKNGYSTSEALSILSDLESTSYGITSNDYINQYNVYKDPSNYETGDFNKYKYSQVEWIEGNIIYLIVVNDNSNDSLTSLFDILYNIGIIEMKNGTIQESTISLLLNITELKNDINSSMSDYLDYIAYKSINISLAYEDAGTVPIDEILSSGYNSYIESKDQTVNNSDITEGEFIEENNNSDENLLSDDDIQNNVSFELSNDNSISPDLLNTSDYLSQMNDIMNSSIAEAPSYATYDVYYTVNKNEKNPKYIDTGISLISSEDGEGTITYSKLIYVLNTIVKKANDCYFIEDIDKLMLVCDGKISVFNIKENITQAELETLLDEFKTIGLKVSLKDTETESNSSNSLNTKVDAGEIKDIMINNSQITLTNVPIIKSNMLQLPVNEIATQLGYTVETNKKTTTLKKSINATNTIEIIITTGSKNFTINGEKSTLKTEVQSINGIIYSEFNTIADESNYTYTYDSENGTINFNNK